MSEKDNITKNYYDKNFKEYIQDTFFQDMSFQYSLFEKYLNTGDKILEIGFGSGRDYIYFSKKYEVYGIDVSTEFVKNLKDKGYKNVFLKKAEDFCFDFCFDGIWACASLLHIKREDLKNTFCNILNHLKTGGIFYFSFKYGNFFGERNGRYFCDMNEELLKELIDCNNIAILDTIITSDVRKNRQDKWFNVILRKL